MFASLLRILHTRGWAWIAWERILATRSLRSRMSGRDARVYRDMLMAIMGRILVELYGEEALDALSEWHLRRVEERWRRVAEETGRSDPLIFLQLFTPEVHEYEVVRKSEKSLEVIVRRCLHAEVLKRMGAQDVGLKLICMGDDAATRGYNPRLKLRRPKILMRGDDACHFIWELEE